MKLLQANDYLLFIDEEAEIKEYFDGYVYQPHWKKPVKLENSSISLNYAEEDRKEYGGGKIIAYRKLNKKVKELDLPELPPFEVDIEKLAFNYTLPRGFNRTDAGVSIMKAFIAGYKEAQSKQFSLEDVKKAIEMAREADSIDGTVDLDVVLCFPNADNSDLRVKWSEEEIIQSLSTQQLPVSFEPEYEITYKEYKNGKKELISVEFHKITNSEGKEVLVGTYKY